MSCLTTAKREWRDVWIRGTVLQPVWRMQAIVIRRPRRRLRHACKHRYVATIFQWIACIQWRLLHTTRWVHGMHPLLQIAGWVGGAPWVEEQQTTNSPNCTDHHETAMAEPKKWSIATNFSDALRWTCALPPSTIKFAPVRHCNWIPQGADLGTCEKGDGPSVPLFSPRLFSLSLSLPSPLP